MDSRLGTTALVVSDCKLADMFDISVARSICGGEKAKIQYLVSAFVNFVRLLFQRLLF